MRSSLISAVPGYLGVDLTDRYSKGCRKVDVCGLTPVDEDKLTATFWHWSWDAAPEPLDVQSIASELLAAKATMVDGPQGLAQEGNSLRAAERASAAVGKTPDTRPNLATPFAGFICSSLDLFEALHRAGIKVNPSGAVGGVSEVYPGHLWTLLNGGHLLPKKSTTSGRSARRQILQALGVCGIPPLPTHDENDACVSALLAAAGDRKVRGVSVTGIGCELFSDLAGTLREGQMMIPQVSSDIAERISQALRDQPISAPKPTTDPVAGRDEIQARATDLLDTLIDKALAGHPQVCTYSSAYRYLFNAPNAPWERRYTSAIIGVASSTPLRLLPGLGFVRLDTFIVSQKEGRPSDGHWDSANYDVEDWQRVLGTAELYFPL